MRSTIQMVLCAVALAAALRGGPYRLELDGRVLVVTAGGSVIRREQAAADLPPRERKRLENGIWAATDAGLAALMEDYSS